MVNQKIIEKTSISQRAKGRKRNIMFDVSMFSRHQWLTILVFVVAEFCSAVCVSLQVSLMGRDSLCIFPTRHIFQPFCGNADNWIFRTPKFSRKIVELSGIFIQSSKKIRIRKLLNNNHLSQWKTNNFSLEYQIL